MKNFKLITYRPGVIYPGHIFYILNKGNNSGKPLNEPCPNCFVCICENEDHKEQLYWLLFGLWQGKAFHPHLIGSVIPFIRLREVTNLIYKGLEKLKTNPDKFQKNISTIIKIEKQRETIQKQFELMQQMKRILILEVLN